MLADNELNPALPEEAFNVVKQQTAQFVAGRMKSPGYRAGRALNAALLPANDPELRETTPQTVSSLTLDDVKQYYAKALRPDLTTITVIGDITPDQAKACRREMVRVLESRGRETRSRPASRASKWRGSGQRARPEPVAG